MISVPEETTIFLLGIISAIFIIARLVQRKLSFKQLLASILLSVLFISLTVQSLGMFYLFSELRNATIHYNLIPFGNLFYNSTPELYSEFLFSISLQLFLTLALSLAWGFFMPYIHKVETYKKLILITSLTLLPMEILFMFFNYTGLANEGFDTGSFILLFVGVTLGWKFYTALMLEKGEK